MKNAALNLNDSVLLDEKKNESSIFSFFLSCALFFMVLLLCFVVFFGLCNIRMSSMNNTLFEGDNVLVYRYPAKINRGDIIVIDEKPATSNQQGYPSLIKRAIALGGDTIRFETHERVSLYKYEVKLFLKKSGDSEFIELTEPYIKEPMVSDINAYGDCYFGILNIDILVPEGYIYALGDNRNNSSDSRHYNAFDSNTVSSKVALILEHDSLLENFVKFLFGAD